MTSRSTRLLPLAMIVGATLVGVFAMMVVRYRTALRTEIRRTIINRDAAVLQPVALQRLAQMESISDSETETAASLLATVLESAQQKNMLGVAIFDAQGRIMQYAPDSLLFAELSIDDYALLLKSEPISRYHPAFPLERYFAGISPTPSQLATPVLEVLLPLHGSNPDKILGFAQYYIDARQLTRELASIDDRINHQTTATLGIGAALIAAVVTVSYFRLLRAQRAVAERNEQLTRANFELTLAAKASALGQITSHLIHGLQGSVAGLRAVVTNHDHTPLSSEDWQSAAGYTERMQSLIQDTVGMLGDIEAKTTYELSGRELADTIRQRHTAQAASKGVTFSVQDNFRHALDSHRGSLICLITANLVDNAIAATPAGGGVNVSLNNGDGRFTLIVTDQGTGIPESVRAHLFQPGRSTKPGGTGLGLAISQLLARQIGAELSLPQSDHEGTTFNLSVPLKVAG